MFGGCSIQIPELQLYQIKLRHDISWEFSKLLESIIFHNISICVEK